MNKEMKKDINLNPWFVIGISDVDSSFNLSISKHSKTKF